jgi:hypothetical protein
MHGWKISQMKEMENWPLLSATATQHHQFVIVFLSIFQIDAFFPPSQIIAERERE